MTDKLKRLKKYLPIDIFDSLVLLPQRVQESITEIRLRLERPSSVTIHNQNILLMKGDNPVVLSGDEISLCFRKICEHSPYKYESEIKNGYITLAGGYRVGFCGSRRENGFLKDISSLSFRIVRQVDGAALPIIEKLFEGETLLSTLIVGAPCSGKTTMLTDIAQKLSSRGLRVAIIDERCEIAAVHKGMPQKDVGALCDVLDNYPKGKGMMIALRCLSPQVIICDEVGSGQDVSAMMEAFHAGVPVIASAHADSVESLMLRPQMKILTESRALQQIFLLDAASTPGRIKQTVRGDEIYEIHRANHADGRQCILDKALH